MVAVCNQYITKENKMKNYQLVFDLGSQYISAGLKQDGFFDKIPALVAHGGADGKEIVGVGMDALRIHNTSGGATKLSRPILEGAIIDVDGVKALIKKLLTHVVNTRVANLHNYSILCAVPCGMISSDKKNIESLFLELGAKQVSFVETPIADSLQLFGEFRCRQGVIVDMGCDCVDIAVVVADSIVSGCTLYHGGKAITEEIAKRIRAKYMVQLSFDQAERLKIDCGSLFANDTTVVNVIGQNVEQGTMENISVSSREIYDILCDFAKKYVQIIQSLVNGLTDDIKPLVRNSGVMLCGGVAKTHGIDVQMQTQLNMPVYVANQSENVTINGLLQK
jgi:actin-like ATPase involved in cell morphogenesis